MTQRRGPSRRRKRINSHEAFVHDSIDSLDYDRGRIADPHVTPQFPFKVYLTRTTDDVVRVVKEARALDQTATVQAGAVPIPSGNGAGPPTAGGWASG